MLKPDQINSFSNHAIKEKALNLDTPLQKALKLKESEKKPFWSGVDPLELAYLMIFESVQLDHTTAQIQAKSVEQNAQDQNKLISLEAVMNFYTFRHSQLYHNKIVGGTAVCTGSKVVWKNKKYAYTRAKVAQTALEDMQFKNEVVSAMRGIMEDKLNVLKQNASVEETKLNTTSDESQQAMSQGSSIMQMLISLTNQITRI